MRHMWILVDVLSHFKLQCWVVIFYMKGQKLVDMKVLFLGAVRPLPSLLWEEDVFILKSVWFSFA